MYQTIENFRIRNPYLYQTCNLQCHFQQVHHIKHVYLWFDYHLYFIGEGNEVPSKLTRETGDSLIGLFSDEIKVAKARLNQEVQDQFNPPKSSKDTPEDCNEDGETTGRLRENRDTQEDCNEDGETTGRLRENRDTPEDCNEDGETTGRLRENRDTQEDCNEDGETTGRLRENRDTQEDCNEDGETTGRLRENRDTQEDCNEDGETRRLRENTAINLHCHRAGVDAFMTGYAFLTYLLLTQSKVKHKGEDSGLSNKDSWLSSFSSARNKIYLSYKTFPLELYKTAFTKTSQRHNIMLTNLQTEFH